MDECEGGFAGFFEDLLVSEQVGNAIGGRSPCWRVPSTSPGPRSSKSTSAMRKPSLVCSSAESRRSGLVAGRFGKQKAIRGKLATADATAELVQLRDAESLGLENHHQRCVGDVDSDFDDGRRDERLDGAVSEGVHGGLFVGVVHASVYNVEAESLSARRLADVRTPLRRFREHRRREHLRLRSTRGQTNVGLSSALQMFADELPRFGTGGIVIDAAGDDRLPTGWQLGDRRDVEIAELRQTEASRDRGVAVMTSTWG